jgi:hypothetical protein
MDVTFNTDWLVGRGLYIGTHHAVADIPPSS